MNGLNTNSVAHFLFISYNLEIVEIGIFLNIYSAIFGELFQTQLSLCVYSKLLEQYILERVTFVWMFSPPVEYRYVSQLFIRGGGGVSSCPLSQKMHVFQIF